MNLYVMNMDHWKKYLTGLAFAKKYVSNGVWIIPRKKIEGVEKKLEIDESKFRWRQYKVGCIFERQWVFDGVCRQTRQFSPVASKNRCQKRRRRRRSICECWQSEAWQKQSGFTPASTPMYTENFPSFNTGWNMEPTVVNNCWELL